MDTKTKTFKKFWVKEVNNYICDADYNGRDLKERSPFPSFRKYWFIKSVEDLEGFTKRDGMSNIELCAKLLLQNSNPTEHPLLQDETKKEEGSNSSESEITKGEWCINPVETLYFDIGIKLPLIKDGKEMPIGFSFKQICRAEYDFKESYYSVPLKEAKANAELIASAPRLKQENERLQKTVNHLVETGSSKLSQKLLKESEEKAKLLRGALENIQNHKGDAEQGLHTYINELKEIAKATLEQTK